MVVCFVFLWKSERNIGARQVERAAGFSGARWSSSSSSSSVVDTVTVKVDGDYTERRRGDSIYREQSKSTNRQFYYLPASLHAGVDDAMAKIVCYKVSLLRCL